MIDRVYIVRGHIEYVGFIILGVFESGGFAHKLKADTEGDPDRGFYAVTVSEWLIGETHDAHFDRVGEDET